MANRYFDEKDHAALYHRYMFSPPESIYQMIFSFLKEKIDEPFGLAVDIGCGPGNSTYPLAPHFEKVLGIDNSEAQINTAKQFCMKPNVFFCIASAEALPFQDASVDLVTASVAAHWFEVDKFIKEACRVLKPNGCLAVHCFNENLELHYENGPSDKLTEIFQEIWHFLKSLGPNNGYVALKAKYQNIFNSIPFPEKRIYYNLPDLLPLSLSEVMGFIESLCSYQYFLRNNPDAAKDFLKKIKERILEAVEYLPKEK